MKDKRKTIALWIVAVALTGIGYLVYSVVSNPAFDVPEVINTPPTHYWEVFSGEARYVLKSSYVIKPQHDSVICKYSYKEDFLIQQYAMQAIDDRGLKDMISIENRNDLNKNGSIFNMIGSNLTCFYYQALFPKVAHLKVSLNSDSTTTIALNDTVVCLYSNIKNFSVKHQKSDKSAIFCEINPSYEESKPTPTTIPMILMFIKKQRTIYFLAMSINKPTAHLEPDALFKLIYP